ncbi:MAG TPA: hypothetical protein VHQ20_01680 [Patescibacteria group bacterium]|nr:hypothetical protein [Patescibacteria group bacterium]
MNETYKHYAIGFLAAIVLMALVRVVIVVHDGGLQSKANMAMPDDSGSEEPVIHVPNYSPGFWWIMFGFNHEGSGYATSTGVQEVPGTEMPCGPGCH